VDFSEIVPPPSDSKVPFFFPEKNRDILTVFWIQNKRAKRERAFSVPRAKTCGSVRFRSATSRALPMMKRQSRKFSLFYDEDFYVAYDKMLPLEVWYYIFKGFSCNELFHKIATVCLLS
jgi:hypothetical protein